MLLGRGWGAEGNIDLEIEQGVRTDKWVSVGPSLFEMQERYWELQAERERLEARMTEIRVEQQEIDEFMAINSPGWHETRRSHGKGEILENGDTQ